MASKLKEYFPIIRERKEVLMEIKKDKALQEKFGTWPKEQQEDFLDICTGVKGLKFLYDGFFKEIMNPEYVPERLNDFLSQMLNQEVKVIKVLPADSTRIADEGSLLIMDIVVELEDGSIANLEMQKIGFSFPGQRSACYSADLLLRQYKRIRGEMAAVARQIPEADTEQRIDKAATKKKFSYRDIKNVYTIVLFEKSPKDFHKFPEKYYHFFEQKSDTGLQMELLQKYLFIPLDIFQQNKHNINIREKRDAWLALLTSDDPDMIIKLIEEYPDFRKIYEEGYGICLNIERVMDMFSKELYELDKNTTQYMIDEMQETIDEMHGTMNEMQETIDAQNAIISAKDQAIREMQEQGIRKIIKVLKDLNIPEKEIVGKICDQYQTDEGQVRKYLK